MESTPPLPFALPRRLTPARLALVVAAVGGGLVVLPLLASCDDVRREMNRRDSALIVLVATTTLLSLALLRRALASTSWQIAILRSVFGGAALGALNAGLSLAIMEMIDRGRPGEALGLFLFGTLFGSIFGVPLGLAYGSAYAVLVVEALRAKAEPSHDAIDRMLVRAGAWLAIAALLALLFGEAKILPEAWVEPPRSARLVAHLFEERGAPMHAAAYAALAAGLVFFAGGLFRLFARRRWLQRVAAGEVAAWSLEPRVDAEAKGLLPLVRGARSDAMLVHRAPAGAAPYRDHRPGVPLALAPLPPR